MNDRLIKEYTQYGKDSLTDYLLILATDVENSMISAGAVPGKDYTYLDIFKMATTLYAAQIEAKVTGE
mgnify:CR=1 FL=1